MTKIFKALKVLEKNKDKDTPFVSKSIDKLMRFFQKKFPQEYNIDKNLNDLAMESKQENISVNEEDQDSK